MNKTITIANTGTAAFPIWTVWLDTEDENGFLVEELSEVLAKFPTFKQAKEFADNQI